MSGYLIAVGLGLFAFIIIALLGVMGTLEAINEQNERAKWDAWSKRRQKNS
jgi:hypothetical protein